MATAMTQICGRCGAEAPAAARFCSSCGAVLGDVLREERRMVTVLFADLSGFVELAEARDAEEVKVIVDRVFERCGEVVQSYGGHVDKVIGDEIMAVFGAPHAHEDDAERAVRAALAIHRDIAALSSELEKERGVALRLHVGVNTGEVVAGYVAGSETYTVLGDAVNTARRIEEAAEPGQTLVGETTYQAARNAIEFRRLGAVTAKGKRLPVTVWEAVTERGLPGERALRAAPLIGREEELELLGALAGMVRRDGRPLAVTVLGDAGMGKSRLAAEFARRIAATGVRMLNGRSLPYGTVSPAFALEEMLRAALLVPSGVADEDVREWVRERLHRLGLHAEIDAVLALLGLGSPGASRDLVAGSSGAPGASAPTASRAQPVHAALAVLERTAETEGMLVLAFHELHWAEDDVLDAVQQVLQASRAPLLLLCLARRSLLDRRPDWGTSVGSSVIALEQLPRDRAGLMLDALAPGLPLPVRERILDRAGGNPLFLEELARLLPGRRVRPDEDFPIPASVQALVAARLDAMPLAEKRLLQDAAVVGEHFWPGVLEQIEPRSDTQRLLEVLESHGFIESYEAGTLLAEGGSYRFRQTVVRDVAYGSVPKHVRAEHHLRIARWLEETIVAARREREFLDVTAYHYERAAVLAREIGRPDAEAEAKAREHLVRAGEQALGRDAAATAAALLRRALALAPADEALPIRIRLAEALVGLRPGDEAEEQLRHVLQEARASGDRHAEAKALRLLSDSARMCGDADRGRALLEEARRIAEEVDDEREQADGFRSSGLLDLVQGRWSSAVEWFRRALALYREIEDRRGEGWSLQNLGWVSMLMGRTDDALQYFADAEELFGALDDHEGVGWCQGMRGWVLLVRGDVMAASAVAETLEHHLRVEHPEYLAHNAFVLELQKILRAYTDVLLGKLGRAEETARRAVESGEWQGAWWAQALGLYPIVVAGILTRRLELAGEAVEAGLRAARSFGDPFYEGLFVFASAWVAYEEGRLDDAERTLDDLTGRGELGRVWEVMPSGRWLRGTLLRARGRQREAIALLEGATTRADIGLATPVRVQALLASILLDEGEPERAVEVARGACGLVREAVVWRAVALRVLATGLLALGDAAGAEVAVREELEALDDSDWGVERVRAFAVLAQALDAQRRHDESAETLDRAREILASLPGGTDAGILEAALLA